MKKTKLKKAAEICACFHLRKASRIVTNLFDEALSESGLTSTQFVTLVTLFTEGELSHDQLSQILFMEKSTVSRLLKTIECQGYIRQKKHKGSTQSFASITKSGEKILDRCVPLWERAQGDVTKAISQKRWSQIKTGLEKLEVLKK